jgi:DNA-binding HxlR family transcriptional regulator
MLYKQVRTLMVYSTYMNTVAASYPSDNCPSEQALSIIDGKWNINILIFLASQGTLRFGELRKLLPGITQRMLTSKLRELESRQIITRTVYPVVPPKVEYSLTPAGQALEPVLAALRDWSLKHDRISSS